MSAPNVDSWAAVPSDQGGENQQNAVNIQPTIYAALATGAIVSPTLMPAQMPPQGDYSNSSFPLPQSSGEVSPITLTVRPVTTTTADYSSASVDIQQQPQQEAPHEEEDEKEDTPLTPSTNNENRFSKSLPGSRPGSRPTSAKSSTPVVEVSLKPSGIDEYRKRMKEKWENGNESNASASSTGGIISPGNNTDIELRDMGGHETASNHSGNNDAGGSNSNNAGGFSAPSVNFEAIQDVLTPKVMLGCGGGLLGICLLCCLAALIVIIPIVIDGVHYVDLYDIGVPYNKLTRTVENKAYTPGRYWLGPGYTFLTFKRTAQTVEFTQDSLGAITTRTKEGLSITIEISFQYKLVPENFMLMFQEFAERFTQFIILEAKEIIRDVSSMYESVDFFNDRISIGNHMLQALKDRFTELYGAVDVMFLQFRDIRVQSGLEASIADKEVTRQSIMFAELDRELLGIRKTMSNTVDTLRTQITRIEAEADAKATIIVANARKSAIKLMYDAEQEMNQVLMAKLGLNAEEVSMYKYIQYVKMYGIDKMYVNLHSPFVVDVSFKTATQAVQHIREQEVSSLVGEK